MSITVVTSTIGRPELRQCIESVRAQTFRAEHLIFVNGSKHWDNATNVQVAMKPTGTFWEQEFRLYSETGDYGAGPSMADVFAASAFLAQSEWICWLDDDNWFDPDHVESLLEHCKRNDLAWAYSLRRFVAKDGTLICDDDWCSLGHYPVLGTKEHLVDNSCFFVRRDLARRFALAWTAMPLVADRCFTLALMKSGVKYGCTGISTVNYRIGTGTAQNPPEYYLEQARRARMEMPDGFPWREPRVFASHSA